MYASRFVEVEHGTFTSLVFSTTGGMADKCKRFHSRLAELIALKKGEEYSTTTILDPDLSVPPFLISALLCLRGARAPRRVRTMDVVDGDFDIDRQHAGIK